MEEDSKLSDEAPGNAPECEAPTSTWKHLEPRPDSWRRQYYLKARNMTVGQLVSTILANKESPEQASEYFELPLEVIQEAILYYERNKALIQQEAAVEREALAAQGFKLEPSPLSR
jgi:uncharacterized protein (DUF433 family)